MVGKTITLLLSLLMSVSVYGQFEVVSQAPFTGGVLTQTLVIPSGTPSLPALAFSAETSLGIFRVGSQTIGFGMAGFEYFRFQPGVFRITTGAIELQPTAAPAAPSSGARIYIDTADSDLKIKYSDGTVVVIGNKP